MEVTCPIRSVARPGVPDLKLQGLIVVIGPNSSGKTQFLHDVNETVCGRRRQLVVASGVFFGGNHPLLTDTSSSWSTGAPFARAAPTNFSSEVFSMGPTKVAALFENRKFKPNINNSRRQRNKRRGRFFARICLLEGTRASFVLCSFPQESS